jgi:hypothetical protein
MKKAALILATVATFAAVATAPAEARVLRVRPNLAIAATAAAVAADLAANAYLANAGYGYYGPVYGGPVYYGGWHRGWHYW